jgi:hypothetical protein
VNAISPTAIELAAHFVLSFAKLHLRLNLVHVTCYMTSSYAIHFKGVEMIIDQWNPSKRRYRTETFCYGPRSCPLYRSGPARKVPGRHGMSYTEEDWVDDEATSRRGSDE